MDGPETRFPGPGFVRAMVRRSAVLAAIGIAAGTVLSTDARFALSFALAAGIDIVAMQVVVASSDRDGAGAGLAFGVRLAAKAVLLGIAAVWPSVFSLAAAAAGALVFDTTVLVAGSAAAVRATFAAGMGPTRGGTHACEGGV